MNLLLLHLNIEQYSLPLRLFFLLSCFFLSLVPIPLVAGIQSFQGATDIGKVSIPGFVEYDTSRGFIKRIDVLSGDGWQAMCICRL
jgi:hypothetical protein